jgi:peptide/nickel transport system substrate-binding protein
VFVSVRPRQLLAVLFAFALIASACGGGSDDPVEDAGGSDAADADDTTTDSDGGATDTDTSGGGADESADGSDLVTEDPLAAQSGGTLRVGIEGEPDSLNPTSTAFAPGAILMGTAIFDTLTAWSDDDLWVNNLTESWTPNDDFTSWDMKLRPGITFSDGEPLNADAVLRSVEAQVNDPLIGLIFIPVFDPETPFEKVDDLTVRITPLGSNAVIPAYFATQLGMIGSPAWLDARDADPSLDQMPIGAGPFKIESRVQDSVTRLARNDGWWRDDQEIYLDAIEIFPNNQEGQRADQLLLGDLDMNHSTDGDSAIRLRAEPSIKRIEDDSGEEFFFIFNTSSPPFDDIRVRQAATHAFPREEYNELIDQNIPRVADSLFTPESRWFNPDVTQIVDQPELSGPLIEAYCADVPESCTDGKVDIEYQYNGPSLSLDNTAAVMRNAWEPFFNIETQVVPQDDFITEVATGQFDVTTYRTHGNVDPEIEFTFLSCSAILGVFSLNWSRYCDPAREELLLAQRNTADEAERIELWQQISQSIADSYQYLITNHTNWIVSANENVNGVCDGTNVDGDTLQCSLNGAWRFPQIWLSQ